MKYWMQWTERTKVKKTSKRYFKKRKKRKIKKAGRTAKTEHAVLETLAYRSVFDYPLSFHQVCNYLIHKKRVPADVLQNALNYLVKTRKLGVKNGKYYLYKTKVVSWKKRYNSSVKLLEKAQQTANILAKIPWIQFIGATGSVAAFNAVKNDDIDLFIVTKTKRLWITRGFVFVILKILGQLREEGNTNKKICPNIFVDESNLAWEKKKRNIYVAHEIIMLHPLVDKDETYFKFLRENDWAFRYFGNQDVPDYEVKILKRNNSFLLNGVEALAYKSQLAYMKEKKTREITTRNIIHFNKVDNTKNILTGYSKTCKRLGVKTK